jgi:NadR type nicotinamide-nucleotide adenylyltransferase
MLKIAIIGPESTGKTVLTRQLAEHFHCQWEPEAARTYVEKLGNDYTFEDVCNISRIQIQQEENYENPLLRDDFVFFDTDLIITKVWLEYKYHNVPDFVNHRLSKHFFDFYLLCEPDLPWEFDPVREHGNDREYFFKWYEKEIQQLGTPYSKIHGFQEKRLQNALQAVEIFSTNSMK